MSKQSAHMSPIGFDVPAGTVDTHCHVFDPERFSYWDGRKYTPPSASVQELRRFHEALGVQRTVLVQPSVYGTDNRCLIDAVAQLGANARGIAVIDPSFSSQQLDDLIGQGIVGVRINLEAERGRQIEVAISRLESTVATLRGKDLIIQIYAALPLLRALASRLPGQPHRIVVDHFGLARAVNGPEQDGMGALLDLMSSGKVFVKLSGPYQISTLKPGYEDCGAIGQRFVAHARDQVIWGSDWPHTGGSGRPADTKPTEIEPFRDEDEGLSLDLARVWAPEADDRHRLLAANATKLFGFDDVA
jgi:predicted TIM-barrel fold metal-dependent hydrolase